MKNDVFLGTQKCVTEGLLRGPWCQSARTHICVQRAVCVRWHLPESAHPTVMMQMFRVHHAWFRVYCAWGATSLNSVSLSTVSLSCIFVFAPFFICMDLSIVQTQHP